MLPTIEATVYSGFLLPISQTDLVFSWFLLALILGWITYNNAKKEKTSLPC